MFEDLKHAFITSAIVTFLTSIVIGGAIYITF